MGWTLGIWYVNVFIAGLTIKQLNQILVKPPMRSSQIELLVYGAGCVMDITALLAITCVCLGMCMTGIHSLEPYEPLNLQKTWNIWEDGWFLEASSSWKRSPMGSGFYGMQFGRSFLWETGPADAGAIGRQSQGFGDVYQWGKNRRDLWSWVSVDLSWCSAPQVFDYLAVKAWNEGHQLGHIFLNWVLLMLMKLFGLSYQWDFACFAGTFHDSPSAVVERKSNGLDWWQYFWTCGCRRSEDWRWRWYCLRSLGNFHWLPPSLQHYWTVNLFFCL